MIFETPRSSLTSQSGNEYYYQIKSEFECEWNALGSEDVWPAPIFQYEQHESVNADDYCDVTFKSFYNMKSSLCNEAYLQSCQIRFVYFWPCEITL